MKHTPSYKAMILMGTLAMALTASAFDVNFYAGDSATPFRTIENATRVNFGAESTAVVTIGGESVATENANFTYMTFTNTSGIVDVVAGNGIAIAFDGATVTADGAELIEVINVGGVVVAKAATGRCDVASLASGVYIVRVVANGETAVKRILK